MLPLLMEATKSGAKATMAEIAVVERILVMTESKVTDGGVLALQLLFNAAEQG